MKLIKSIIVSVILSSFALTTVEAAKETFDRSKAKNESREKGSGMATGKRQHKPAIDNDCDGDTDSCKATDYNSSRSNKADSVHQQDGGDIHIRKKPGRAAEKIENGKDERKKPLKHEK